MSPIDFHEGLNGLDAESLRSFSSALPDDYHDWASESGRTSRNDQILDDFPPPPTRAKNMDAITEEETIYPIPKPSIKNMRRNVTTNEFPLLQETNPYEGAEEFNLVNEEGTSYDLIPNR